MSAATGSAASPRARLAVFLYGSGVYVLFLATFGWLIGFVSGAVVPKHVDSGPVGTTARSLLVDLLLLAAFALQHSVMACQRCKRGLTRFLPRATERSTFVLATCLALALLFLQWRPLPSEIWRVEGDVAWVLVGLGALGWSVVLVATFMIDHAALFGLRQAWNHLRGRPHEPPAFRERLLYRVVRHPIMAGFLLAFWSAPVMTLGHLVFAVVTSAYLFLGVSIEERRLLAAHGATYLDYRRRVRAFLPLPRRPS